MIKSTKKAFTLVELIVVITILAILGTIAFISLQGYSADARNTKRTSDTSSLAEKILTYVVGGQASSTFAKGSMEICGNSKSYSGTTGTGIDFQRINENESSFLDPSKKCAYNYDYDTIEIEQNLVTGGTGMVSEYLFLVSTPKEGGLLGGTGSTAYIFNGRWVGTGTNNQIETALAQ